MVKITCMGVKEIRIKLDLYKPVQQLLKSHYINQEGPCKISPLKSSYDD